MPNASSDPMEVGSPLLTVREDPSGHLNENIITAIQTMEKKRPFGIVPIEILQDKRITKNDLKVFIALSSFQGDKGSCYPGREKISERSGVHISHISTITRRLVAYGHLERTQRGRKCSNVYIVHNRVKAKSDQTKGADCAQSPEQKQSSPYEKNLSKQIFKKSPRSFINHRSGRMVTLKESLDKLAETIMVPESVVETVMKENQEATDQTTHDYPKR